MTDPFTRFGADDDRALGRRVADGVREQVPEHPLDLLGRDLDVGQARGDPALELDPAGARLGRERLDAGLDERADRHAVGLERGVVRVDLRELEQVVDEHAERVDLLPHRGQVVLGLDDPVLDRLEHRLERGDRGPQVVARPRHELSPGVEQLLEPRGHLVERGRDLRELRRPALADPRGEVAARDPRRRRAQLAERARDRARHEQRARRSPPPTTRSRPRVSTASACMSNITTPESTTAAIGSDADDQGEPDQAGVDRSEHAERDRREQTRR